MKLQDLLARIARAYRLTVLLVTHDIDEALYLSDRVVLLDGAVHRDYAVDLPCPRRRGDAVCSALKAALLSSLEGAHAA